MKTIFKYPLSVTDTQTIRMPEGAEILTVQMQKDSMCLWALVEDTSPVEPRIILIFGTGHEVTGIDNVYIGTVQMDSLVFHVFEALI
jgi:hypothetical protein